MIQKQITVFHFDDLNETAKKKAIEDNYNINVDFDGWYEGVQENFIEEQKEIGITVDREKIYFSLFDQGSGSSFGGEIDGIKYFDHLTENQRKEYQPILDLVKSGGDEKYFTFNIYNKHGYSGSMTIGYDEDFVENYNFETETEKETIEKLYLDFVDTIQQNVRDDADKLHRRFEKEYFFLTDEEQIIDTLRASDISFWEDGEIFNDRTAIIEYKKQKEQQTTNN